MTADSDSARARATPRQGVLLPSWHRRALAVVMIAIMVCELTWLYGRYEWARWGVDAALLIFFSLGLPLIRMREAYLIGVALVLTALLAATGVTPGATFLEALEQAAFLITFILSIGLLREAAATSPAVLACGVFMTRQPSGRRYFTMQVGGTLIGALINLGSISLLAPLVQRGVREDRGRGASHYVVARVRERRQLTALFRGFAWALNWSPTTVTLAILPLLIPGVHLFELVIAGLVVSSIMHAIGWVEDRIRYRTLRRLLTERNWLPEVVRTPFPTRAFLSLLVVCGLLAGLTWTFRAWGQVDTVPGLLLAAPIVLGGWVVAQHRRLGVSRALALTSEQIVHVATHAIPATAREAMTLSTSGFIGIVGAALLPMQAVARSLGLDIVPDWLFLLGLPILMLAVGQIGPSPVMMVILLGTLIGSMPEPPADPTLIGIAIATGGSLATLATPFASGVIVLSRVTGHPTTSISWKWNLPFSVIALAVLAMVFFVLTGGK